MKSIITQITLAGIALALSISTAQSADKPPKEMGVYLAGSAGIADSDGNDEFAYQLSAGWKFNKYFAIDVRYLDLGDESASVSGFGQAEADTYSYSANAVGSYPFGNDWEVFGQLGVGRLVTDIDVQCEVSSQFCTEGDFKFDESALSYGIGARYSVTRHLSLAAEIDGFREIGNTDFDIDLWVALFGIQYVFE